MTSSVTGVRGISGTTASSTGLSSSSVACQCGPAKIEATKNGSLATGRSRSTAQGVQSGTVSAATSAQGGASGSPSSGGCSSGCPSGATRISAA